MKFQGLSHPWTREQSFNADSSGIRPSREQKQHIYAAKKIIKLAKQFGIDHNFSDSMAHRNPRHYSQPIYQQPEII